MDKNQQEVRCDKWRKLIEEHEKSGLSQINFCKKQGISSSHFSYYRGRIKTKNTSHHDLFAPIHLQKQPMPSDIQILLPNGFKCIIATTTDVAYVKRLMETLLSC